MEKDIKVQNLHSHCRTCLAECDGIKYEVGQLSRGVFQIFKQVTGFPKTENGLFPKCICDSCFYKINTFSEFRIMSKKATHFLEKLVKSYNAKDPINKAVAEEDELEIESSSKGLEISKKSHECSETLQNESCFENIFVQTKIKEDRFENALSPTNGDNSNEYEIPDLVECNIKIEEKEKTCDDHEDRGTTSEADIFAVSNDALFHAHNLADQEKQLFQCNKCDIGYHIKSQLDKHFLNVHGDSKLEAESKADESSDENSSLSVQFEKQLSGKTCNLCKKKFMSKLELRKHMTSHKRKRCAKKDPIVDIEREAQAETQDEVTNLPAIKKTTCKICFNNYASVQKLKVHMRVHLEKRPFPCDQCERSFNEKYRLEQHKSESHANNPIEIVCKFGCGKTFRHLETAKKHYYLKHSGVEKEVKARNYTFVCEHCGRVFKNVTTLREHNYTHLPPEERPYKCDECNKSFTSKRSYKDHQTRHMGIKKFECPHCGLKKTTRKELKYHLNIHTKEKLFTCAVCAKVFNRQAGLKMHERVVHQGIRKYSCSYCDLSFGKPDTLKHHEMRHTGERPHKCQHCDRSFIQVVALRAHLKTHNK